MGTTRGAKLLLYQHCAVPSISIVVVVRCFGDITAVSYSITEEVIVEFEREQYCGNTRL